MRLIRTLMVLLTALAVLPAAASATSVTTPSVDHDYPTPSEGGRSTYVVTFDLSGSGALSATDGDTITVTFPAGTDLGDYDGGWLQHSGLGGDMGSCSFPAGMTVVCTLDAGISIPAGSEVRLGLYGVTHPAAGTHQLTVHTTRDADPAASSSYDVLPATSVTGQSATPVTSSAGNARNQYVVGFTTSPTGGLDSLANSAIDVTFPAGTGFAGYRGGTVHDVTAAADVGTCLSSARAGDTVTCSLTGAAFVSAGHDVELRLDGIDNAPAGAHALDLSTTSDPTVVMAPVTFAAASTASAFAQVSVSTSSADARAAYIWSFTPSATGELSGAAGSEVTFTYPAGTKFDGFLGGWMYNVTKDEIAGSCASGVSVTTVTCSLDSGRSIAPGDSVQVTHRGITNPPAGSYSVTMRTTSDTVSRSFGPFGIGAASQVSAVAVAVSPTLASEGRSAYVVEFTASATGTLTSAANSRISVTFPAGTTFDGLLAGTVRDANSLAHRGSCDSVAFDRTVSCSLSGGAQINAGDAVRVEINGVTNPETPGAYSLSVRTTSDTVAVGSPSYTVSAAQSVSTPAVSIAPATTAGGRTTYSVDFDLSSTGALSHAAHSFLYVTFPAGTGYAGYTGGVVRDVTAGADVGVCHASWTGVANQYACFLNTGAVIAAGRSVRLILTGAGNPPEGAGHTVAISTTSDVVAAVSSPFSVGPVGQVSNASVSIADPSAGEGARTRYLIDFTTSAGGGLDNTSNSEIRVTFPAGTTFGGHLGGPVIDVASGSTVGACSNSFTGLTMTCTLALGKSIGGGRAVRLALDGVTNPAAGAHALTLWTTSDVTPVTPGFTVQAARALSDVSVSVPSTPSTPVDWVVELTTSATGALSAAANSAISVTFPAGTTFGSYLGGTVRDADSNVVVGTCSSGAFALRVATCVLNGGTAIAAGTPLRVTFEQVTTPPGAGPYHVVAATTSDPAGVSTADVTPPTVEIFSGPTAFTNERRPHWEFRSHEPGSTFECRFDGDPFTACTSPFTAPTDLPNGPHLFEVRAIDAAGNVGPPESWDFNVDPPAGGSAGPAPTPAPTPEPTPAPPGAADADRDGVPDSADNCPQIANPVQEDADVDDIGDACDASDASEGPVLAESVITEAVEGKILIRLPGANRFAPLSGAEAIPVGAVIDATKGRVELTSAARGEEEQTAEFYDGIFKVVQKRARNPVTELVLQTQNYRSVCGARARAASAPAIASAKKRRSKKRVMRLWGDGEGDFRTRGNDAVATVRGTKWLTQVQCDGTLVRVARGVVSVRDLHKKTDTTVKAGKKYFARAR